MDTSAPIENRVAKSPLVSLDLETLIPTADRVVIDLADHLYQGLVLREKDFRQWVKEHPWSDYEGRFAAVHCSTDAIVPSWAFMLVATKLKPHVRLVTFGDAAQLEQAIVHQVIDQLPLADYEGAKVVVKGCSDIASPESALVRLTARLQPVVSSLMYGEPCSTVPLYKKPKA